MDAQVQASSFHAFQLPRLADFAPSVFVPRREIPQALLAVEATTYGWDTVNCIRLPVVNEVLKASGAYPPKLSLVLNADENWAIETSFGPWVIAPGGSGAILMMKLPLTAEKMTYGNESLEFADGSIVIALKLRYVPQLPAGLASDPGPVDIEKLIADASRRTPDDPPVVVQKVDYGSAAPTEVQKALFNLSAGLMLTENLDKFTHVFAKVNLNQQADQQKFYWLKPTYTSYAYFQGLTDEASYLAVLNQTENRSPEGLTNQATASAIPAGMNASILISNALFMKQLVMPGLSRTFTRADADAFHISADGKVIEARRTVTLDQVKVGAVYYTPKMTAFTLQIVGDEIQIRTKVMVDISPGIVAYVDAAYFHVLGLVEKPDGTMTLGFKESSPPIIDTWSDVAFWVTMTALLAGILASVLAAIAGPVIKNVTASVIAVVIITVVAGVAAAVPALIAQLVADGTSDALPSIGNMIDEATGPINWPSTSPFKLKSAELNGSFQLGGMLEVA
jgi:hypothetical protein